MVEDEGTVNGRIELKDTGEDILSHAGRKDTIHILTLDDVLAGDVYERIRSDRRFRDFELIRPRSAEISKMLVEIDRMALQTVHSRLLIIDVRRDTLPMLRRAYNKVIGYNRRDLNRLCYTVLIGDGPVSLFQAGKFFDVFVQHLSSHRVDYHPAVFFYDPFLHYEPDEIRRTGVGDQFTFPNKLPKRFARYFEGEGITISQVRRYFRAQDKDDKVKQERLAILVDLYEKRIAEQFPHHQNGLKGWLSHTGLTLASERLHLYPLFFEDWVYELMQKATRG